MGREVVVAITDGHLDLGPYWCLTGASLPFIINSMSQLLDTSMRLSDLGPRYAETDLTHFPVDAWATWTNLVFLFVIVYWARRLRRSDRRHLLLSIALPLLTIGWLGGTVYPATRSSVVWTLLDWGPIVVLVLLAAWWLWRRLLPSAALAFCATLLPLLVAGALARSLANSGPAGISASYAILAAGVVVPAVGNCVRRPDTWLRLAVVLGCFAVALVFRVCDAPLAQAGWPHGSHYLWHIFGGLATFFMFGFLYALRAGDPAAAPGCLAPGGRDV